MQSVTLQRLIQVLEFLGLANVEQFEAQKAQLEARNLETRKEAEARGETQAEIGGPKGLEPTRYGDWVKDGIAIDF